MYRSGGGAAVQAGASAGLQYDHTLFPFSSLTPFIYT